MADYYSILGVTKSSTADDIKKAYRKEALKWHPDRHQGSDKEQAEKKFKELNEAYQVLSDPQKKQSYDQFGHDAFKGGAGGRGGGNPYAGGQGPFTYSYSSSPGQNPFGNADFGDAFDIFESFFGGGSPFGSRSRSVPSYQITIEFMDSIKGVEKTVDINGKRRKIKIPAGISSGSRINFDDFLLTVEVSRHEVFEREGSDIHVNLEIPFSLAILGGSVQVPTVYKLVTIKVRAGTKAGTILRLKGEGAPIVNTSRKGDQYVKIVIDVPQKLTREQKRLVEQMKNEGL